MRHIATILKLWTKGMDCILPAMLLPPQWSRIGLPFEARFRACRLVEYGTPLRVRPLSTAFGSSDYCLIVISEARAGPLRYKYDAFPSCTRVDKVSDRASVVP